MSKQLYGIFAKAKKPYEDAFDRDIAPSMRRDKFKRLVDVSSHELRIAMDEIEACFGDGERLPGNAALREDYERRVEMIAEGQELSSSCKKLLERWSEQSKEDDESAQKEAELLRVTIGEVFPKLETKLAQLEVRNQTEVGRLASENQRIVEENIELKGVANKSLTAEQISAQLQEFLESKVSAPSVSAEVERQIIALLTEKSELEQQIKENKIAYDSKVTARDEIIEGQVSDKNRLKSKLDTAEKQARESETVLRNLRRDVEKSRREVGEKDLKIERLKGNLKKQIDLVNEASGRADQLILEFNSSLTTKQDRINELEAAANGTVIQEKDRQSRELLMKKQIDSITQSRDDAMRKCEKLESELETMKEERKKLQKKFDDAKAEAVRVDEEQAEVIAQLVDTNETLGREKLATEGLLDETKQTLCERDRDISGLQDTEKRLQQEVNTLTCSLASETCLKNAMIRQHKELQALIETGTASLQRKEKLWRGTEEALIKAGKKLQDEIDRLAPFEGHVTTLGQNNQQLQSQVDRLEPFEKQVKKLQADNEQLKAELERLGPFETNAELLQKNLEDLNGTLCEVRMDKQLLQVEVDRLAPFEDQIPTLQAQNKRLQDENDRLALFKNQIPRLEQEKQQLQAKVDELTSFKNAVQTLNQEKRELLSEVDRLKPFEEEVERLNSSLENQTKDINEQVKEMNQKLADEYQAQVDKYVTQQDELCERRVASVQAKLNEATANFNQSKNDLDLWKRHAKSLKSEKENANGKLEEKTSKLKAVEDERDRFSRTLEAQQKDIDNLKLENQRLSTTIERLEPLEQNLQDVEDELQRTKDALTELRLSESTFNKGRAEVAQLKDKISSLEKENARMIQPSVHSQLAASLEAEKEKVKEATGTINTLSASRDNSKKEHEARIADLSQKLQESEEESRTLKNQLGDADTLFVTSNEKHKSALEDVAKLRDKLKNVVPQAVYDQLKQEMVDRTEYDRVCQELAELRLQRSAPWPPREPLSRASSMSSTVGASFTSYASPYAQQHSPSPTSIVQPETPTNWMTRQLSTASIGSGGSPSMTPAVIQAGPFPGFDRSPSVPNVPAASGSLVNTPRPAPNVPRAPGGLGYSFLVSGLLEHGTLTINVAPSLIAKMNAQITRWNGQQDKSSWTTKGSASVTRCVEVRRGAYDRKKAPLANDQNNSVACTRCIRLKQLCVLIGSRGPVVVPLPLGEKGANASPMSGDYYVKS